MASVIYYYFISVNLNYVIDLKMSATEAYFVGFLFFLFKLVKLGLIGLGLRFYFLSELILSFAFVISNGFEFGFTFTFVIAIAIGFEFGFSFGISIGFEFGFGFGFTILTLFLIYISGWYDFMCYIKLEVE